MMIRCMCRLGKERQMSLSINVGWGMEKKEDMVRRDIFCLNKELKLTGQVSFRNSNLTLKEDQEEVLPLLKTDNRKLSEAVMAAHFPTHEHSHKCVNVHTP